jgi:hypothetical protein
VTEYPDVKVFLEYSGRMMDVNGLFAGWEDHFVEKMTTTPDEALRDGFRRGFAKSLSGQLTPLEYEEETGWDFDTAEEFQEHLRRLWVRFYGDADPEDSLV